MNVSRDSNSMPKVKRTRAAPKEILTDEDWAEASDRLMHLEQQMLDNIGLPGPNYDSWYFLQHRPIRAAWNKGIRTPQLYEMIMELELPTRVS